MNVCFRCGMYRADKVIDPSGPYAICPECGYKHRFLQLPLLIVSGASGAGKSTVCHHLLGRVTQAVLLDSDILWRAEFNKPEANYRDFFETWLRVCRNISQSGRPVVLFGAGVGVPENIEDCVERRYFSKVHTWPWPVLTKRWPNDYNGGQPGAAHTSQLTLKNMCASINGSNPTTATISRLSSCWIRRLYLSKRRPTR